MSDLELVVVETREHEIIVSHASEESRITVCCTSIFSKTGFGFRVKFNQDVCLELARIGVESLGAKEDYPRKLKSGESIDLLFLARRNEPFHERLLIVPGLECSVDVSIAKPCKCGAVFELLGDSETQGRDYAIEFNNPPWPR
jgi:hypothetical protein